MSEKFDTTFQSLKRWLPACVTKHFHGPFNSFSIYDNLHENVLYREELSTHNKGKDGYVEKLEFLERADLRFGD